MISWLVFWSADGNVPSSAAPSLVDSTLRILLDSPLQMGLAPVLRIVLVCGFKGKPKGQPSFWEVPTCSRQAVETPSLAPEEEAMGDGPGFGLGFTGFWDVSGNVHIRLPCEGTHLSCGVKGNR